MRNPMRREPPENVEAVPQGEDDAEPQAQQQGAPKARIYYPAPPDIGSGIAAITTSLFADVDDYSYKIIEGNVDVGDRLKFMLLTRAWWVLGLVSAHDEGAARWLDAKITEDERLNGKAFVKNVLIHTGRAVSKSMWGKKGQGVSLDYGEGMEHILSPE